MESNTSIEMRWVEAWNKLLEIVADRRDVPCQLPDWSIVNVELCKAWIQDSVYAGYFVQVESGWVGHSKGVIVTRTSPST